MLGGTLEMWQHAFCASDIVHLCSFGQF